MLRGASSACASRVRALVDLAGPVTVLAIAAVGLYAGEATDYTGSKKRTV